MTKPYTIGAIAYDVHGHSYLCVCFDVAHGPPGAGWVRTWQPPPEPANDNPTKRRTMRNTE
jgi:hypothetical protein